MVVMSCKFEKIEVVLKLSGFTKQSSLPQDWRELPPEVNSGSLQQGHTLIESLKQAKL